MELEKSFRFNFHDCENLVKKYHKYINGDILDIGSNIGFFSQAVISHTNYKTIHLFEPCEKYCEYSKRIKQDNIYFNNYGLSNMNEIKTLYKSPNNNIGWNTFLEQDPNQLDTFINKMNKETCVLKKLDDYDIDNINFIKIDVEGYEHKVLEGAMNIIKKYKPYILIEVGWGTKHPNWDQCEKQYNQLFDIGYKKINFKNYTEDILFEPI